jgi:hypothetical protein
MKSDTRRPKSNRFALFRSIFSQAHYSPILLAVTLVFLPFGLTARSQEDPDSPQAAIDKAMAGLKGVMRELSSLDESDKALAKSNQAQSDTGQMLKTTENRIRTVDGPKLTVRARLYDQNVTKITAGGCPPGGGVVPAALADRCNPLITASNEEHDRIVRAAQDLKDRLASIAKTRDAVTKTTLTNFARQKANQARREELQVTRRDLMTQIISRSLSLIANKAAAVRACESLTDEKAHCCLSIVSDGANPAQCDIELIYKVLENGGAFRSQAVVPRSR